MSEEYNRIKVDLKEKKTGANILELVKNTL